jgi:cell division septation protein DedD
MIEKVNMYCPICDKQIEKYGRRKNDPKILGWTFCPKHGWIKEAVDETEMGAEKTAGFTEEASKKHIEQEKPPEEKDFRAPSEIKNPEASHIPEEEQLSTDLSGEAEVKIADLSKRKINVLRLPLIAVIISIIFGTILLVFLLNFFSWENSTDKNLEMKSSEVIVPAGTSDERFQSQASVLPEKVSSQSKTAEIQKEISLRPSISSKAVFTVQVGAFEDASYAEGLKKELNKKGYKVYITTLELKGNEKLYKVCIGRFSSREKAEVLSTKIKKKEGLQTFVTSGIV